MMMFSQVNWQQLVHKLPWMNGGSTQVGRSSYGNQSVQTGFSLEQLASAWGGQEGDRFGAIQSNGSQGFPDMNAIKQHYNHSYNGYDAMRSMPVFEGSVQGGHSSQRYGFTPPSAFFENIQTKTDTGSFQESSYLDDINNDFPPLPPPEMLQKLQQYKHSSGNQGTSGQGDFPPFPPSEMLQKLQQYKHSSGNQGTSGQGEYHAHRQHSHRVPTWLEGSQKSSSTGLGTQVPSFNVSELDTNGDGEVTAEELIQAILKKRQASQGTTTETSTTSASVA
ncbi:MAG: hypothetical protein ACKO37_03045 [Vampirovibrionales bacterium]